MSINYGFGELENKLIDLFRDGLPDFNAADELIRQGADINAVGECKEENVLSEILYCYKYTAQKIISDDLCEDCYEGSCEGCENRVTTHDAGVSMLEVIRYFLKNGFNVNKCDGCFGAQCLWALALSTFDKYMIEAVKLLFDAGAKNRTATTDSDDQDETPWNYVGTEGSYQAVCEHNHSLANIYEAMYQVYQAVEDGKPYSGISTYEAALGKTVLKIMAESDGENPVFFSMNLPQFKRDNCFTKTLYFVYDTGVLITTQYGDFWTDTVLPDIDLIDVSEHFIGITGDTIKNFTFDHRSVEIESTCYGQPITIIETDSGHKLRFSINFGEVKDEERAAFYELL